MKAALLIKTKNLGDAVILTASIAALRDRYRIHVLCFSDAAPLYSNLAGVERVWSVRRGERGWPSVRSGLKLIRGLSSVGFDLLVQYSDDWRGALVARTINPRVSVAHRWLRRRRIWRNSFTHLAPLTPRRHAVEQDIDLLRRVGLYSGEPPSYQISRESLSDPRAHELMLLYGLTRKEFLVVHLFSRWSFKQISQGTTARLIELLAASGRPLVLTGDAADKLKFEALNLAQHPNIHTIFGERLETFASILSSARAVISVDSLAVHLSSAVCTPTVAIFGPSGEANWRPWGTKYRIIHQSERYPCRPCGLDGCGGSKLSQCLATLEPEMIIASLDDLLTA